MYLPCLLLLAGYTLNADAGPLDNPPPAALPPAGIYGTDPARTQIVDEFEALPVPRWIRFGAAASTVASLGQGP